MLIFNNSAITNYIEQIVCDKWMKLSIWVSFEFYFHNIIVKLFHGIIHNIILHSELRPVNIFKKIGLQFNCSNEILKKRETA